MTQPPPIFNFRPLERDFSTLASCPSLGSGSAGRSYPARSWGPSSSLSRVEESRRRRRQSEYIGSPDLLFKVGGFYRPITNELRTGHAAEKVRRDVILSVAKDLQLYVFKAILQMLRSAQQDRRAFRSPLQSSYALLSRAKGGSHE